MTGVAGVPVVGGYRFDGEAVCWSLPENVVRLILSVLNAKDLCMVGMVCKEWYEISSEEWLWERLFQYAKYHHILEYVSPKKAAYLKEKSAKEKFVLTYCKEADLLGKAQDVLTFAKVHLTLENQVYSHGEFIKGEVTASFLDSMQINGIFIYLSCTETVSNAFSDVEKKKSKCTLISELIWEIPIKSENPSDPIKPSLMYIYPPNARPKLSEYLTLPTTSIKKGTYTWPFQLATSSIPPTWSCTSYPYTARISHQCTAMVYRILPYSMITNFISNRIAESDSIDLKVVTDNEKLKANLGHLITESPNVLFSNQINLPREGLQTKWTFSMPIKEYYHVGDTVEIEAQYEATTAQNDPTALKSISLEISLAMDLKFAHLDEKYEVKLEKTRYENIIPPKTKHTFKMAYHLDPKMFQIFGDKQIYIWPNVDTGLENNFRLTVRSVGSVFTQDVEIVSIPLKAILLR
eukprot:TRINITY_DN21386_c0_g1_i1.p1 TRINITY_DN21386_c0_g1~~TRINITY_DN21386_c0_g1_i1.p1  ORF type:complete len:518 (-),score=120.21 TRINITY_DN21386_c0_g1_i1:15-1406(-)